MLYNLIFVLIILFSPYCLCKVNKTKSIKQNQIIKEEVKKRVENIEKKDQFIEILNNKQKSILMCSMDYCGFCKMIEPKFYELADKYNKINFYLVNGPKLDADEIIENKLKLSKDKKLKKQKIDGYPAFIFINNKKIIKVLLGADKNKLEKELKDFNHK